MDTSNASKINNTSEPCEPLDQEVQANSDSLRALASSDKVLSIGQVREALKRAVIVSADDDQLILNVVARSFGASLVREGSLTSRFDSISQQINTTAPLIIACNSGNEAQEAMQIAIDRQIRDSIFIFDYHMPEGPTGLEIFMGAKDSLHPQNTRVLYSGTLPDNCNDYLLDGTMDLTLPKPLDPGKLREKITKAYLRTRFGIPSVCPNKSLEPSSG